MIDLTAKITLTNDKTHIYAHVRFNGFDSYVDCYEINTKLSLEENIKNYIDDVKGNDR